MTYSVGQSAVTDYANTSSGKVTNVAADNGVGGSGEVVNVNNRAVVNLTVSTNTPFLLVNVPALSGYIAGKSDITITINSGVYVYGVPPVRRVGAAASAISITSAMEIIGGTSGDTIAIINNGYIAGYGGDGAYLSGFNVNCCGYTATTANPTNGGTAISVVSSTGCPVTITNTGFIAGGGGGGGGVQDGGPKFYSGGGGAGGGYSPNVSQLPQSRATPSSITGDNGTFTQYIDNFCNVVYSVYGSGGGGFGFPGTGGSTSTTAVFFQLGVGGTGGGSGSGFGATHIYTISGGSADNNAQTTTAFSDASQSGGGGGWGGSGGSAYDTLSLVQVGTAGGAAIVKNGNTVIANGTIYGAIDTTSTSVSYVISTSVNKLMLDLYTIPGIASNTDVVIIVAPNVFVYSDDISSAALTLENTANIAVKSIRIILSTGSAIMGAGGTGGGDSTVNSIGGDAILLVGSFVSSFPITLDCTNGYILGGGGGGGYGNNLSVSPTVISYGGGGAGGGNSGSVSGNNIALGASAGTTASGSNGSIVTVGSVTYVSGGGGGTMRPSTTTTMPLATTIGQFAGVGGGGGGSGAVNRAATAPTTMPQGGGIGQAGQTLGPLTVNAGGSGGGGGGWGAASARGTRLSTLVQASKVGGRAIRSPIGLPATIYVINENNIAGTIA